jgi:hypothetical protein
VTGNAGDLRGFDRTLKSQALPFTGGKSSPSGMGVSPVNDGQSRGTRDRPTNTGQEPGNETEGDSQVKAEVPA